MKRRRWLGAVVVLAAVAGVAYVGQEATPAGAKMTAAAQRFLAGLDDGQRQKARFAFDDANRTSWWFTPQQDNQKQPTRKGLPLKAMNEEQRKLALGLLRAGTSDLGNEKALAVMSLENVLRELEMGKGPGRDPQWYFVSIFGSPEPTGKWGWRIEGHHLSLNFTIENGKVVSATPSFYGANPREILASDRKGFRALPKEEDLARQLVKSLDPELRKLAIISDQVPKDDIKEGNAQPSLDAAPKGIAVGKMSREQRDTLLALLKEYTGKLANDIGGPMMNEVMDAGVDKIHFAWWGGLEARQPHVYRVQGPTFLLEYVCVQNEANHIHSCWRSAKADFGLAAK